MAQQRKPRVPRTRTVYKPPRVELTEIQCISVTLIRDERGKVKGHGYGNVREIRSVEEFAEYFRTCEAEVRAANKEGT